MGKIDVITYKYVINIYIAGILNIDDTVTGDLWIYLCIFPGVSRY
jgi:hypothetical protein